MFYRLQIIVNDLKGLGEKVEDKDFSHKFLMCLPKKFFILRRMIFREGLDKVTQNLDKSTRIGVMATGPTRSFGVPAVVNSA
jgi:hypothetical protein